MSGRVGALADEIEKRLAELRAKETNDTFGATLQYESLKYFLGQNVQTILEALRAVGGEAAQESLADLIPTTWLDPLLTGPNAALPKHLNQINGLHIEALLRGLQKRIRDAETSREYVPRKEGE